MPLAWLPMGVLYIIASLLAPVLYHIVRYRRKVTDTNLRHSFPNLDDSQRQKIAKNYYRHLADLLAEALFGLRATPPEIRNHYQIINRELIDHYYEQGQSVILVSSHYNNWEFMVVGLNMFFRHHGIGVGKPLDNKGFGVWLTRKRTRYGTEVVDQTNIRETMAFYDQHHVPCVYMMLADQSPSNTYKCFWTTFLNQETCFLYGPEYFARKYNYPVLYYEVKKIKRGHYQLSISELCGKPNEVPQYTITQKYISRLYRLLQADPAYWLWSHKRWKRTRPDGVPTHTPIDSSIQ